MFKCKSLVMATVGVMLIVSVSEMALPNGPIRRCVQQFRNRAVQQRAPHGVNVSRQRTIVRSQPIVNQQIAPTCNGPNCIQWARPTYFQPTYIPTETLVQPQIPSKIVATGKTKPIQRSFDTDAITTAESGDSFRRSMFKATRSARKAGAITGTQAIRVRVAMFSPAFRQHAKTLSLIQMASSDDSDALPRDSAGNINATAIDWDGFAAFLERMVPVILQLLEAFGV